MAKPKTNRKSGPHSPLSDVSLLDQWQRFSLLRYYHAHMCSTHQGEDTVIAYPRFVGSSRDLQREKGRGMNFSTLAHAAASSDTASPRHQKNAHAMECMQGDTVPTCPNITWLARYCIRTVSSTSAHSLLCLSQAALLCGLYLTLYGVHRICYLRQQIIATLQAWHHSTNQPRAVNDYIPANSGRIASSRRIGPTSDGAHHMPGTKLLMLFLWISLRIQPVSTVCVDARVDADTTAASEASRHGLIVSTAQPDPTKGGRDRTIVHMHEQCAWEVRRTRDDGDHCRGSLREPLYHSMWEKGRPLEFPHKHGKF